MLTMDFCNQYALGEALYGKIQMFLHNYTIGAKFWHEATFYTMTNLVCFWNV